jgi:hypothetical protein
MPKVRVLDAAGAKVAEWIDGGLTFFSLGRPASILQQSPDGTLVTKDGQFLIDARLWKWSLVGKNVFVDQGDGNGSQSYKAGYAKTLLMWNGAVVHENPNGLGWISETDTGWSNPGPDPRAPVVKPPPVVIIPPVDVPPANPGTGATTGSISGNVLTVADSTGFKVGDPIVVATPINVGEDGPGGGWPEQRFDTPDAGKGVPDGTFFGVGGVVYLKQLGQVKAKRDWDNNYYDWFVNPKALIANITKIEGNKWTLDKTSKRTLPSVDVFFDGAPRLSKAVQDAPNGKSLDEPTRINVNVLYPGWKRVAMGGAFVGQNKQFIKLTSDGRDSFEFFAPSRAPGLIFQWRQCIGIRTDLFKRTGNFREKDWGGPWQGSTSIPPVQGFLPPSSGGWLFAPGNEFFGCTDCESADQTVIDVPIAAGRSEGSTNCWFRRIKNKQTEPHRAYVQWQFQHASYKDCGWEDCEFDSDHLTPAFEFMHGTGGQNLRPKMRNGMMATNNSGGWKIVSPRLTFDAGCMKAMEDSPSYWQYGTGSGFGVPAININTNAGNWAVAPGGILTDVIIDQSAGYLDSKGNNLVGLSVQEKIVNFELNGLDARYPAKRSPNSGGAVGLQAYGPNGKYDRVKVTGECMNAQNNWNVFILNGGSIGSIDAPPGGKYINGTSS